MGKRTDLIPAKGQGSKKQAMSATPSERNFHFDVRELRQVFGVEADQPASLSWVLHALLQWWKFAVPAGLLLASASAALVLYLFVPQYRATAWIQIERRIPYLAFQTDEEGLQAEQFAETQMELIRSPMVLTPALQDPSLAEHSDLVNTAEKLEEIAETLKVAPVRNSQLYQIHYDSANPEQAADIINAIVVAYFKLREATNSEQAERVIEILEQERHLRSAEIQQHREEVTRLAKELTGREPLSMSSLKGEFRLVNSPLDELQGLLTNAEVDNKILEVQSRALREAIARKDLEVPEIIIEQRLSEEAEIQHLKAQIASQRAMLHRTETVAKGGKNDPHYQSLARQIAVNEKLLQDAMAAFRLGVREELQRMAVLESQKQLDELEADLEIRRSMERMLSDRYQQQLAELEGSSDQAVALEFARAELARQERVVDMLSERITALRTELRAPGRVTLLKLATVPETPLNVIPLRNLLLAVLGSLCLPFILALLHEQRIGRISETGQLESKAELPVVAEIARLPASARMPRPLSLRKRRARSLFEEGVDGLRTRLVLGQAEDIVQAICISSAVPQEGKSSVAAQLALSFATVGRERTLLIDCDLRSPDVHRLFRLPAAPGLAEVLTGKAALTHTIVKECYPYLDILPAGRLQGSAHQLIASEGLRSCLAKLRSTYRFIVIDTAPILSASESLVLANLADGTVLCALRGYSRETQVRLAHARLDAARARILGTVLNGVPSKRYRDTYGSYPASTSQA